MRAWLAAGVALIAAGLPSLAAADGKLGVVLLHGKEGLPTHMPALASAMSAAGYLVERPEMCWSRRRIYDLAYLDCLKDVDKAAEKLRTQGATAIVVAGMSQGGNAALAYGARREGLKGIVALAPAPPVEFLSRRPDIARSVKEAQTMVAAGRGERQATFADFNRGGPIEVATTATIYLSFFGPDALGVMPDNRKAEGAGADRVGPRRPEPAQHPLRVRARADAQAQLVRFGRRRPSRHAGRGARRGAELAQGSGRAVNRGPFARPPHFSAEKAVGTSSWLAMLAMI
jgi:dienelactone hydrolase